MLALSAKGALDAWYDNNAPRDPKDWGWPTCDDPGTRSFTLEAKDGNPAAKCVFRGQLMEGGVRYDLISTTPGRLSYKNVGEMGVVRSPRGDFSGESRRRRGGDVDISLMNRGGGTWIFLR